MIKLLVIYTIAFALLFLIIHFSQDYILNQIDGNVRFNLWDTNLFFAIASFVICLHFLIFSQIESLKPQLGFIYLPTLFIKGVIFFFSFKAAIFNLDILTTLERLNLLIPFLLFLGLEVYFVVKIIKENEG